eukprot:666149-Prorocentrum_minimum.AAC.1
MPTGRRSMTVLGAACAWRRTRRSTRGSPTCPSQASTQTPICSPAQGQAAQDPPARAGCVNKKK